MGFEAVSCSKMSLLSSSWPHLTTAATIAFIHLICLLILLPGDRTAPLPPSPSFCPPSPLHSIYSINWWFNEMKTSSVTTNHRVHFSFFAFISKEIYKLQELLFLLFTFMCSQSQTTSSSTFPLLFSIFVIFPGALINSNGPFIG